MGAITQKQAIADAKSKITGIPVFSETWDEAIKQGQNAQRVTTPLARRRQEYTAYTDSVNAGIGGNSVLPEVRWTDADEKAYQKEREGLNNTMMKGAQAQAEKEYYTEWWSRPEAQSDYLGIKRAEADALAMGRAKDEADRRKQLKAQQIENRNILTTTQGAEQGKSGTKNLGGQKV